MHGRGWRHDARCCGRRSRRPGPCGQDWNRPSRGAFPRRARSLVHGARGTTADPNRREWAPRCRDGGRDRQRLYRLAPNDELVTVFDGAGGTGQPRYAEMTVCWAKTSGPPVRRRPRAAAQRRHPRRTQRRTPALPRHFEQAAGALTVDQLTKKIPVRAKRRNPCRDDQAPTSIRFSTTSGSIRFGPAQEAFLTAYAEDVLPKVA